MVCVDGFILTHLFEPIELPDQKQVDRFLPPYRFSRTLDARHPLSLGTLVGPAAFAETRAAVDRTLHRALDVIPAVEAAWQDMAGRGSGGLLRIEDRDGAKAGVLTIGSVFGTVLESCAVNDVPLKVMALRTFRPFPAQALRDACRGLSDLVVLERALSPGAGGIVANEVRAALYGMADAPRVHGAAAGLGGRDIGIDIAERLLALTRAEEVTTFEIIDLIDARMEAEHV